MYMPPPSANLFGLSLGLALRTARSVSGIASFGMACSLDSTGFGGNQKRPQRVDLGGIQTHAVARVVNHQFALVIHFQAELRTGWLRRLPCLPLLLLLFPFDSHEILSICQERAHLVALGTGCRERYVRIGTERQLVFLAVAVKLHMPLARTGGRDAQAQPAAVAQFVRFALGGPR